MAKAKILIALLGLALLAGMAFAQDEIPPYPTQYWVKGRIVSGTTGITDLSGFTVILYRNSGGPWLAYAVAVSDVSGSFRINAMDDLRMLPLTATNYYIGVGSRTVGGRSYGMNQRIVAVDATDLSNGFKSVADLTLADGEGVWVPGGPIGDTGLIRNTQIYRESDGNPATPDRILLSWEYAPGSGLRQADIWELRGADAAFSLNTTTGWSYRATTSPDLLSAQTGRMSGDANNAYYRVVPHAAVRENLMDLRWNTRTACKIDIRFRGGGITNYVLATLPLYGGSMNATLAGQATQNMIFWPQSGSGVAPIEWTPTAPLIRDIEVRPGVGYWVENDGASDMTITFVGTAETSGSRDIAQRDLSGNPSPVTINSSTLGGASGDLIWPQSGSGLGVIENMSGAWPAFTLGITQGFWYWHEGQRHFLMNLLDPEGAKIREGLSP